MLYAFILGLTLLLVSYILYRGRKIREFNKIKYTQSGIHEIIKNFIPSNFFDKPKKLSQAKKHAEKNTIKVLFVGDKAYWVANNIFYAADVFNGDVDIETANPINTEDMTKKDIEKMLFILDNLRNGKTNDSGSAGNEKF